MNAKQLLPAAFIAGLTCCLTCHAQVDNRMAQTNSHWHVVSCSFSNSFGLMPTNVPVQYIPLKNGQWAWTTNMLEPWQGGEVDSVKLKQFRLQQLQRMDETDPPGIANVMGYQLRGLDEKHYWNTNMAVTWWGIWVEDTNTGWRVNLKIYGTNTPDMKMTVHVGSILSNSGAGLLPTPDDKFAKLELSDSTGKIVPTKPGAALKIYEYGGTNISRPHPMPSSRDTSVEANYPATIPDTEYPRWKSGDGLQAGRFAKFVGFVSNGPPCHIGYIKFNDIFSIKTEGDYTLTVQPVLYRMHYDGGTFQGYLNRVDLPSVTTKVHLVPNVK